VCQEQPAAARDCQRHLTGRAHPLATATLIVLLLAFIAMVMALVKA
jgi:hypothetical protein